VHFVSLTALVLYFSYHTW